MARSIDRETPNEGSPIDSGKGRISGTRAWLQHTPKMIELGPIERYEVSDTVTGIHTACDSKADALEVYEKLTALGHECMILEIRNRIGPSGAASEFNTNTKGRT